MATNHGVGGSNPSSPTIIPKRPLPLNGKKASKDYDSRRFGKASAVRPKASRDGEQTKSKEFRIREGKEDPMARDLHACTIT